MGNDNSNQGLSRRQVIKRGAIAGGAMVWAAPMVARPAFAQATFGGTEAPENDCRCFFQELTVGSGTFIRIAVNQWSPNSRELKLQAQSNAQCVEQADQICNSDTIYNWTVTSSDSTVSPESDGDPTDEFTVRLLSPTDADGDTHVHAEVDVEFLCGPNICRISGAVDLVLDDDSATVISCSGDC